MQELISALATKKICVQNMKIIISLKLTTKELNISAFSTWGPFVCGMMLRRLHLSAAGNRTYMFFSLLGKNIKYILMHKGTGEWKNEFTNERTSEGTSERRPNERSNERTNEQAN